MSTQPQDDTFTLSADGCSLAPAPCSPVGAIVTDLPAKHYQTIVIDPPWPGPGEHRSMKGGGVTIIPYSTMTGIQLAAMRIMDIAAEGSQLWMWTTSRNFVDAGLLLQLWGYRYAGLFIWKKPPNLGPWIRHDSEFLMRGVMPGAEIKLPAPVQTHEWPRPKRHSEKPPEAYRMIEEYSPGPRIDIFARQPRPGFDAWGNQAPDSSQANKPLGADFTKNGFQYRELARDGRAAIYRKFTRDLTGYEVVITDSDESWTYSDRRVAWAAFIGLVEKLRKEDR